MPEGTVEPDRFEEAVLLEAKDIQIRFKQRTLLTGGNISLIKGQVSGIRGRTGCGKTSLLRVLGLLSKPYEGQIFLSGNTRKSLTSLSRAKQDEIIRQYFAYVFQDAELMMNWDAIDNISLPLIAKGYSKTACQEKAEALCQAMGIDTAVFKGKEGNKPELVSTLSGGEKQRIGIARALAKEPQILLADEPTGSLDNKTKESILDLFFKVVEEKQIATVLVTHDPDVMAKCHRKYVLEESTLVNI